MKSFLKQLVTNTLSIVLAGFVLLWAVAGISPADLASRSAASLTADIHTSLSTRGDWQTMTDREVYASLKAKFEPSDVLETRAYAQVVEPPAGLEYAQVAGGSTSMETAFADATPEIPTVPGPDVQSVAGEKPIAVVDGKSADDGTQDPSTGAVEADKAPDSSNVVTHKVNGQLVRFIRLSKHEIRKGSGLFEILEHVAGEKLSGERLMAGLKASYLPGENADELKAVFAQADKDGNIDLDAFKLMGHGDMLVPDMSEQALSTTDLAHMTGTSPEPATNPSA